MNLLTHVLVLSLAGGLLMASPGCAAARRGPYTTTSADARDTARAQKLTLEACEIMAKRPDRAEALLREALDADLFHGPAHNNLGVLYLKQGKLYEAASELEWAKRLLPGHPDPRMNLALVLEHAGRVDQALAEYQSALEVYPGHLPSLQAQARLMVRSGRVPDRESLEQIALRGETSHWREWARLQLAKAEPHP